MSAGAVTTAPLSQRPGSPTNTTLVGTLAKEFKLPIISVAWFELLPVSAPLLALAFSLALSDGSLTPPVRLGVDAETGKDVNIPFCDMLPMVHPNDLVLGGWDISGMPMDQAMRRAKVMEWDLQQQLHPLMSQMVPLPSIYYPDLCVLSSCDGYVF